MNKNLLNAVKLKSWYAVSRDVLRLRTERAIFYAKGNENLGDSMVPWLAKKMSGIDFAYSNPLEKRGPHLLSIGSILRSANAECYVWGSGFIEKSDKPKGAPKSITALRGPLTHQRLAQLGISAPKVYGDPALLTSRFLKKDYQPDGHTIGIIPHFADFEFFNSIKSKIDKNYKLIDIRTSNIVKFVNEIINCEYIISSSLHGIVVSESYGIPSVWCELSDNVVGKGFKFWDYISSSNRIVSKANLEDIIQFRSHKYILPNIKNISEIQDRIYNSFPVEFK
jgi:pyruvyltransferase